MFKILIVEDDTDKLRSVMQLIKSIDKFKEEIDTTIDTTIDSASAKRLLRENNYDLLILDIAIPPNKESDVDLRGGLNLIEEVFTREKYKTPNHIVGLTVEEEVFETADLAMRDKLLRVIRYSESDNEWKDLLSNAINQWVSSKINMSKDVLRNYEYQAVIVCALQEELDANLNNGWDWHVKNDEDDCSIYYVTHVVTVEGEPPLKIIAGHAARMGMPATTALATKMALKFKPNYLFMTGIMAGVSGRVELGDVIVGDPVWDWGSGKWIGDSEKSDFQSDFYQFKLDPMLVKEIRLLMNDEPYLFNVRKSFSGMSPSWDLRVHLGPVASGASVISNAEKMDELKSQHRKLLGIEMESFGLFSAAEICPESKPIAIAIKSVVDFGDATKSDSYHKYACYSSAEIAKKLIINLFT